ncbi:1,6-anhydro-N-acetylmuramyl-L-alanine amidase AmpD [Thermithiobacillus plumbiphilus]|uniref:1,6-anhydro-N-acetylmuramyl-L-alanine amidase AmpD n=1 Tax=Thermithiobacillus plumbiphilus TaxID=1729899 RepID=A0ABU9DAR2_9PROT
MSAMIDTAGWYSAARILPSPNFNARPPGVVVDLIVLHAISLPPGQFGGGHIERFFQNRLEIPAHPYFAEIQHLQVSAHFLIDRAGCVTQFVSTEDRAWHAGVSCWSARENCNDFSVGIELEGSESVPFSDAQYVQCARLCRQLQRRYPQIGEDRIVGHQDVAPGRKWDPGPQFRWDGFRSLLRDSEREQGEELG